MSVAAKSGNMTTGVIIVASVIFLVVYSVVIALKNITYWVLVKSFGSTDDSYVSLFGSIKPAENSSDKTIKK